MSVYFIQVGRYIKIGYSANPEQRCRRLFASTTRYVAPKDTPLDLASRTLLKVIAGDKSVEREIHAAVRDFRVWTEWFIDEPELRQFVDNVRPPRRNARKAYRPVSRPAGEFMWQEDPILGFTPEEKGQLAYALTHMFDKVPDLVPAPTDSLTSAPPVALVGDPSP